MVITLGTGIGGGIVVDGKILTGAHGAGGEISHMPMQKDETEVCGCGKRGCAEQYGSANGILRLARRRMERSNLPSPLRGMEPLTCKDIFDLSAQGDPLAREIQEEYFDFLGQFLADVCCVIDPEAVLLGGGVSKAGQPLLDGVRKYFLSYMFHTGQDIFFALAKLGNDAGASTAASSWPWMPLGGKNGRSGVRRRSCRGHSRHLRRPQWKGRHPGVPG